MPGREMTAVHIVLGVAVVAANLAAGLYGGRRVVALVPPARFLAAAAHRPGARRRPGRARRRARSRWARTCPRLHLVYGLTPLAVAFFAEQLRAVSAQTELDRRELAGRDDVARLSEIDQRLLVEAIVRREIGVMAASALVVAGLGVRASGWF